MIILIRRCDKCVVRFDHHNILINNCIGYNNQHVYVLFLLFGIANSTYYLIRGFCIPLYVEGLCKKNIVLLFAPIIVSVATFSSSSIPCNMSVHAIVIMSR